MSEWLDEFDAGAENDVPCGVCTACCTSSQFVHIEPDESDTLAHVPVALRFPAPGLPKGHVVLGYDERGHCPMLVDGACSIYEHRPRTCRTYDCRVFAVTGVEPDQPAIAARVREWQLEIDDEQRVVRLRAAVPADGPPIARALHALAGSGLAEDHGSPVPPGRERRHDGRQRRRDEHRDEQSADQRD